MSSDNTSRCKACGAQIIWIEDQHGKRVHATNDIGVTLRDWFAGQVIRGLLAGDGADTAKQLATAGYEIADAMLAEREGGGR